MRYPRAPSLSLMPTASNKYVIVSQEDMYAHVLTPEESNRFYFSYLEAVIARSVFQNSANSYFPPSSPATQANLCPVVSKLRSVFSEQGAMC